MNKVQLLFDYIYYRIYKFFQGRGDNVPEWTGMLLLSLMQFLTLLDILVFVRIFYPIPVPDKIFVIPVIVVIGVLNWLRYERNFNLEELENRWKDENRQKRIIYGWLIGLYLLTSFLIPAVHGYLEHNLEVI